MTPKIRLTRRAAIAGAAALPFAHVRTARAAGKLAVAFISSFLPGWNEAIQRLVETWGKRNAVSVEADFLGIPTNQYLVTQAAEAQARRGHDIIQLPDYNVARYAARLEPVDDLIARMAAANGPPVEGI